MNTSYQIRVYHQEKILGVFSPTGTTSRQSIRKIINLLQVDSDIQFEIYREIEDSRILIFKNGEMKKLSTNYSYEKTDLAELDINNE